MAKEQEAEQARSKARESVQRDDDLSKSGLEKPLAMAPAIPQKKPLDPRIEAINARFDEFKALDHAGQVALFTQTLNDEALMDHEMAFDMLEDLYKHSIKMGDYEITPQQLSLLRECLRQSKSGWEVNIMQANGRPHGANAMMSDTIEA